MARKPNTPAAIGDNSGDIDYGKEIDSQLNRDYAELVRTTNEKLEAARQKYTAATICENDEQLGEINTIVVEFRDIDKKLEALRIAEGQPHHRRWQAVNGWFKGHQDGLTKAMNFIGAIGHRYNQKKIDEERRAREEAARIAREAEDKARREREAAERAAREAEQAAARKRNAESIAEANRVAEEARQKAEAAAAAEREAMRKTDTTTDATAVKSADLSRQTHAGGRMTTARQVGYAKVLDYDQIDLNVLRPYFKRDHIDAALNAFAKAKRHEVALEHAEIGYRDDTVYR